MSRNAANKSMIQRAFKLRANKLPFDDDAFLRAAM